MKCEICGCKNTEGNPVTKGADPYDQEVGGDNTAIWECDKCREKSTDDI